MAVLIFHFLTCSPINGRDLAEFYNKLPVDIYTYNIHVNEILRDDLFNVIPLLKDQSAVGTYKQTRCTLIKKL